MKKVYLMVSISLLTIFQFFISSAQTIKVQTDPNLADYGLVTLGLSTSDFRKIEFEQADLKSLLQVFVSNTQTDQQIPQVIGTHLMANRSIQFRPKYPPPPGISYHVIFNGKLIGLSDYSTVVRFDFSNYERPSQVLRILPAEDTLPANILRFYIEFDSPMSLQNPYDHIKIVEESGRQISESFVELKDGLWSPDRKRLTVLIHPGRIKRGVGPNSTLGNVFDSGKSYSIMVDSSWKNSNGLQLDKAYHKSFFVSDAIRARIDTDNWMINPPKLGTVEPLVISFDRPMDAALCYRTIEITEMDRRIVDGLVEYRKDSKLSFTPTLAWSNDEILISISDGLEDVCGNSLVGAFDRQSVDLMPEPSYQRSKTLIVKLTK